MSEEEQHIITFEPLTHYETEIVSGFRIICAQDPAAAGALIALVQAAVACLEMQETER